MYRTTCEDGQPGDDASVELAHATLPGLGFVAGWSIWQRDLVLTLILAGVLVGIELGSGGALLQPREGLFVPSWTGWLFIAATLAPLPWRRLHADRVIAISGMATGAYFVVGFTSTIGTVAVLFALYASSGYARSRWDGVISLAISLFFVTFSFSFTSEGPVSETLSSYALTMMLFVTAWGLGEATRSRRALQLQLLERAERAEEAQRLEHERATAEERNRIARELHDVVAHTVSVLVVQAGAGRHVAARDPRRAAQVLGQIEDTGREALDELRRVLGVLRAADPAPAVEGHREPQPTLASLPDLVAPLRGAGLPVRLDVDDRRSSDRPLPSGVELSVYRIVQEALTNVLKHAGAVDDVHVRLAVADDGIALTVTDDGHGPPLGAAPDLARHGSGQGVLGMRERVDMLGGRLTVGPRRGGGFRVHAHVPLADAVVPADQDQPEQDVVA